MRALLSSVDTKYIVEIASPFHDKLYGDGGWFCPNADSGGDVYRSKPAIPLRRSRSHTHDFSSVFGFIKESYVWLVWIPLVFIALGIGMNFLAVTMNHGVMPVVLTGSGTLADQDKVHAAATANSRFLFLCDWIQLYAGTDVASPGDYLITAGEFLRWPVIWIWVGLTGAQLNWRKSSGFSEKLS
jgi:Family of unknown function (DUF5317)